MLLIFLLIFICLIILGIVLTSKRLEFGVCFTVFGVGGIGSLISLFAIIVAITQTIKLPQMDNRIAVYEEENTRIEEQIKTAIQVYQEHEKEIYGNINLDGVSSEKLLLLTSVYPELKSDTMIQELINVYNENIEQVKSLKTEKFDCELARWWLYFG